METSNKNNGWKKTGQGEVQQNGINRERSVWELLTGGLVCNAGTVGLKLSVAVTKLALSHMFLLK